MFDTILVANRGEIAVRIIATLRRMGVRSVAVYSDADEGARHVREADLAVRIGPAPAGESYLRIERIVDAALQSGAQGIHPGYGFLSENASLVRAAESAGLVFVGPSAGVVEIMGDKIQAKRTVLEVGVPVVPGRMDPSMTDEELVEAAWEIGFPVIVKPSAGGGGKGMRVVESPDGLSESIASARREAMSSFGEDTLFLERFLTKPRHIEVQILADNYGNVVHLGERECSLQRRHQKVIEEAPSYLLDTIHRARISELAVRTASAVGYRSVGTVEFIVSRDAPDDFYFMEMNTRLQVEHPVTEFITGFDLVEQQLRVAAGEKLGSTQEKILFEGHAIEARIYAEDPQREFLPTGGRVLLLRNPIGEGIRVDSSLVEGLGITSNYDPMLAKVIAHGPDRTTALARLDRALASMVILGVTTNTTFLRALLNDEGVRSGNFDTGLIERTLPQLIAKDSRNAPPLEVLAAYALCRLTDLDPRTAIIDRWEVPDGWRVGEVSPIRWKVATPDGSTWNVAISGRPADAIIEIEVLGAAAGSVSSRVSGSAVSQPGEGNSGHFSVVVEGRSYQVFCMDDGDESWIWMEGTTYALKSLPLHRRSATSVGAGEEVRSPMPGVVLAVDVVTGSIVERGDRLAVIEAMKMEHAVVAPQGGVIVEVFVSVGDQVTVDQVVARVVEQSLGALEEESVVS